MNGLLGIVSSKELWFSNILYLNDGSEFTYTLELVREELLRKLNNDTTNDEKFSIVVKGLLRSFESMFNHLIDNLGIFVFSLSKFGDLLSQWRGYCSGGLGYSIGFSKPYIERLINDNGINIRPCIYDKKEQIEKVNDLIMKFVYDIIKYRPANLTSFLNDKEFIDFSAHIFNLATTFKHPSFKEEQEWRLISKPISLIPEENIFFRQGKTMIIPYQKYHLVKTNDELEFAKLIIGPTENKPLAKHSIEMLLNIKKVKCESIELSLIPYRDWY